MTVTVTTRSQKQILLCLPTQTILELSVHFVEGVRLVVYVLSGSPLPLRARFLPAALAAQLDDLELSLAPDVVAVVRSQRCYADYADYGYAAALKVFAAVAGAALSTAARSWETEKELGSACPAHEGFEAATVGEQCYANLQSGRREIEFAYLHLQQSHERTLFQNAVFPDAAYVALEKSEGYD